MNFPFKKWNNILGFVMLFIGAIVYLSTMERQVSFWDCGEFIVISSKLGVGHAPGAALFQIIGAVWSGLAFGDGDKIPLIINSMSAISSALTIMFLFWTITHLARRMFFVTKQNEQIDDAHKMTMTKSQSLIVLGAGLVGSAAFMFSDTFWFSAVEAEVYAMASLFTAILVWMGCKWEEEADEKRANRWFILISFFVGLSTGVHFMALLAIPAVCYLFYARNYRFTVKSFIIANIFIVLFLAFVYVFLFGWVMTFFGKTEVYVVNNFGMPFNSGTFIAGLITALVFYLALKYTFKYNWKFGNTMVLSVLFMLIGFSCWIMLGVRANANPPINLNDPDTALGMLDYFNREQYGNMVTTYGPGYVAHIADDGISYDENGVARFKKIGENYIKDRNTKKYKRVSDRKKYVYNSKYVKFFPKMFSDDPSVMENYAALYGFPEFSLNPYFFNDPEDPADIKAQKKEVSQRIYSDLVQKRNDGTIRISDLQKNADLLNIEPPTFWQEVNYFLDFQIGYMGFRYFMWNFSGKQNDWEGQMEVTKGNWISGIPFLDNARLGDQSKLPAVYKENKGHNRYFMLPLFLGLIGFFVQLNRNLTHWWAILSLFLLTSVGIIFYTSVKPFEPRERDYALVSSFYAFAIWIGLGVQGIYFLIQKLRKDIPAPSTAMIITGACLAVPVLMGFQNWDDHDRSNRKGAHALAYNYINDLDENSILFVYGDNDTYPLWGLSETSGWRDDVKIVNYTLLGSPWNIEQSLRKTYDAPRLPSKLQPTDYQLGTNDDVIIAGGTVKSVFDQLNSIIRPDIDMNLSEVMSLPPSEITQYLIDPGYMAEGLKELYNSIKPLEQYVEKDSMTAQEAVDFILDNKNPAKLALAEYIGYPVGAVNYLPVNKIIIPVNKENVLKYGIVSAADADKIADYLTVNITGRHLYKNDFLYLSMFAEYEWDRAIYFSGGGISDPANTFYLNDYLENNGFSYKLIPIYTKFGEGGKLGRSNAEKGYHAFNNFEWANYNLKNASFSNTDRNYTNTYRNIASRLANDFMDKGDNKKAKEVLDRVMAMIPDDPRYDYGLSTERIALAYQRLGEQEAADKLLTTTKQRLMEKMGFYESLPGGLRYTVAGDMADTRSDYSLMIYDLTNELIENGDREGALKLFKSEYEPVREKLIRDFKKYGEDGIIDNREQRIVDGQFRFLSELLGIAEIVDSVYAEKETDELYRILSEEN